MFNEALKLKIYEPVDFRGLVAGALEKSDLFRNESEKIIKIIEQEEFEDYIQNEESERKKDIAKCLKTIYDETKKENPDSDLIDSALELMKNLLRV